MAGEVTPLNIVIKHEFIGMRPQVHCLNLIHHLVVNPCINDILGEYISLEQESMIILQGIQGITQGTGRLGYLACLFRWKIIDVLI
jgi:hypothetical protein